MLEIITNRIYQETVSLLITVLDQTLAIRTCKLIILTKQGSEKCKMCSKRDEAVMQCSKLSQTKYKKSHDKVTTKAHWKPCSKYGFEPAKRWYEYRTEKVMEESKYRDFVEFQH